MAITDLTGCTWVGNDTIYANSFGSIKNVNFKERNTTYNSLYCFYDGIDNMINYGSSLVYESGWYNNFYKTITFTGGTDAINAQLIAWLQANGTLTAPTPTKTFDLSTLQLSAGTHEIKVKARATDYRDSEFSNSVSYVVQASTFFFTIAGTTYQAEPNMTWAQWVNSEYNTDSYIISRNYVYTSTRSQNVMYSGSVSVVSSDTIEANHNYILGGGGGN